MGWRGGGGGWACNSLTPGISARRSNSVDEAKKRGITLKACKLRKRDHRLSTPVALPAIYPDSYLPSSRPAHLVRMLEQKHPSSRPSHHSCILEQNLPSYLLRVLEKKLPSYLLRVLEQNLPSYLLRVLSRSLFLLLLTSLPHILDCTLYSSLPRLFGPIPLHIPERVILPSPLSFLLPSSFPTCLPSSYPLSYSGSLSDLTIFPSLHNRILKPRPRLPPGLAGQGGPGGGGRWAVRLASCSKARR